jgi:hypothetical protein
VDVFVEDNCLHYQEHCLLKGESVVFTSMMSGEDFFGRIASVRPHEVGQPPFSLALALHPHAHIIPAVSAGVQRFRSTKSFLVEGGQHGDGSLTRFVGLFSILQLLVKLTDGTKARIHLSYLRNGRIKLKLDDDYALDD